MGNIFLVEGRVIPDKQVVNATYTNEYQTPKIKPKTVINTFIKKSTYINYDIDGYEFRNDFQISDTPTVIELTKYCKQSEIANEILVKCNTSKSLRLHVDLKNNHKKFTLKFGTVSDGYASEYGTLVQKFNHETQLLSKPELVLTDNIETVYSDSIINPRISFDITSKSITLLDYRLQKVYTWNLSSTELYLKLISGENERLDTDFILSRTSI